jgi:hypothetical protein
MAIILLLITTLSVVSGSNSDGWREELEKRLSVIEESNAHLRNENERLNSLVLDIQRENREIKRKMRGLREQLTNCETVSGTEDAQQEEEVEIFSQKPMHRIYQGKNQPVKRISE